MRHPHANPLIADAVDQLKRETDDDEPRQMTRPELLEVQRQQHEAQRAKAHAEIDRLFDETWARSVAQVEAVFREIAGQKAS